MESKEKPDPSPENRVLRAMLRHWRRHRRRVRRNRRDSDDWVNAPSGNWQMNKASA